jgi:hypothetical protein
MIDEEPGKEALRMVETIDSALREAVAQRDDDDQYGGVLIRWIVVADVMAVKTGARNLRIVTPEDTTVWEAVGMLESAKTEVDPAFVVLERE